jgi:hypothetical protein
LIVLLRTERGQADVAKKSRRLHARQEHVHAGAERDAHRIEAAAGRAGVFCTMAEVWAHSDVLYQAYLTAYLVLNTINGGNSVPLNPGTRITRPRRKTGLARWVSPISQRR